jgi:hypothetical protein
MKTKDGDIAQEWLDLAGAHGEQAVLDAMVKVPTGQRWPSAVSKVLGPIMADVSSDDAFYQRCDAAVDELVSQFTNNTQDNL